jgi:hypothetical protein
MRSAFYFELLAHRAVLIARSARCDVRWVAAVFVEADGNGKALLRHLLPQIGGANIKNPPTSWSLANETTRLLAPYSLLAPFAEAGAC